MTLLLPEAGTDQANAGLLTIVFPEGLIGFPAWRRFRLTPAASNPDVMVLDSLDEDGLRFLAIDPLVIAPDYAAAVATATQGEVSALSADAALLALLTVEQRSGRLTANLLGPLVIATASGTGRQVVLADSSYSTRHPLPGSGTPVRVKGRASHARTDA